MIEEDSDDAFVYLAVRNSCFHAIGDIAYSECGTSLQMPHAMYIDGIIDAQTCKKWLYERGQLNHA